ncbi:hypothetical protein TNCV_4487141 [Trichonephila clavipes]|nr:hypothetical protein TNCV_4487141 [Trichonephila clavipes]
MQGQKCRSCESWCQDAEGKKTETELDIIILLKVCPTASALNNNQKSFGRPVSGSAWNSVVLVASWHVTHPPGRYRYSSDKRLIHKKKD